MFNKNRNISRFHYLLFGILFGLCFPLLATVIEMSGGNFSFLDVLLGRTNRLMLIIDSAPVVLGFVFYWVGLKQEKISELYLRKAKNDLEKSQSLLERAERVGKYGSWEFDLVTKKISWSNGLYAIFKLDPSESLPDFNSFLSQVLASDQLLVQQVMKDALENGKREFSIQYHIKLKDGSIRTMRGQGSVLINEIGVPLKMFGTVQDVTELNLAQREAEFYKQAIDQSSIVAITDYSGVITHVNDNFCLISGYQKEELIGKTHRILNSRLMGEDFFRNMWKTISSGKIWRGDICNRSKDGHLYWVDSVIVPFIGLSGRPENYIAIRSDITQRKVAEAEILQAHQRLELAEGIGHIGSWECDDRHQNFRCSKGLFSLLKVPSEMKFSYKDFLEFIDINDRDIFESVVEQSIAANQSLVCPFRVNLSDGIQLWLQADGKPICSSDSKLEKLLVTIRDITEKVESDKHLLDFSNKAELASKTKARFLANMSHEIRTPMNGIIGMTNLLLGSIKDQDQISKLKIIHNCGNNLMDLINDILDFSKLEVDKLELENEPFSLHDSVNEVVELLSTRASENGLTLSYIPEVGVPAWIKSDVTRFRQIIINLVSNAIKFTEKGSVTISSKAIKQSDNWYDFQFSVRDTGIGIPDEVKNRLFQSFSQVDASTTRKFGGTGLGLAITKGICEKMGGTVWVESTVGVGSVFTFTFKSEVTDAILSVQSANPFEAVDCEMGKKMPLKILVAEDNIVNQLVILGLLEKLGYQADVVSNGLQVLDRLKLKTYDLLLLDCHMPLMDGFETSEKITVQYTPIERPRIIAVTASNMKEDIDRCFSVGMDGFIGKPIVIPSLIKILTECKRK